MDQQHADAANEASAYNPSGASLISPMDIVLGTLIQPGVDSNMRRRNLEMILRSASKFTFLLFSQLGSFHFDFAGDHGSTFVVFPTLLQVNGDNFQALRPPRVLYGKEISGTSPGYGAR